MIGKLDTFMVVVKDMDRSVKFYRDVLGLKVKSQEPEWTALDAGAVQIGLHAESEHLHVRPTEAAGFGFDVDDIHKTIESLKAKGTHIIMPPKQERFGWLSIFTDPDGYHIQLHQPIAKQNRSAA